MRPLKCYAVAALCLWDGHVPVPGTVYSWVLGRRVSCVCCKRCRKLLAHEVLDRL